MWLWQIRQEGARMVRRTRGDGNIARGSGGYQSKLLGVET